MSEFIDNVEQEPRVQNLLEFVRRVHEGADVEPTAAEYEDTIESVRPYDVLVVEDVLLGEGASVTKIKSEIEPVLKLVGPALEEFDWDRPDRGHPVDNFLRENRAVESHLTELTRLAEKIEGAESAPLTAIGEVQTHIEALADVETHFVRKENELFPHLEAHWKHDKPLGVMWSIHDDIRSTRSSIESLLSDPETNPKTFVNLLSKLTSLLQGLIFKEERIIFPVAMESLSEDQWAEIQRHSLDIGYFEIEPQFAFADPDAKSETDDGRNPSNADDTGTGRLPPGAVTVGFETGSLDVAHIEMLWDTLPVDVTYVDEDDRVRYFNNPDDRIFPRSGSIIGRTVQNCHPPESVDRVEEILDAFRNGDEDEARFWIQNGDAFVVIEYYALRDDAGTYRGTLEVTQEVSDIRDLADEKRLVDWGGE